MKKSVWRMKSLGGFIISIEDLEELFAHIMSQFDENDNATIYVRFNFKDEAIEFDDLTEITRKMSNRRKIEDFEVNAHGGGKNVTIESKELKIFGNTAAIRSYGDSEVWCAGINESISSLLQGRGLWASFLADNILLTPLRALRTISLITGVLLFVLYIRIMFSTEAGGKDLLANLGLVTISSLSTLTATCLVFALFTSLFVNKFSTGRIILKERDLNIQNIYGLLSLVISIAAMLIGLLNYLK